MRKSAPQWKVQFVSYKKSDYENSKAKKPKREWDISKSRWSSLGFHAQMSILEARARAKQLNAQLHLRRQEAAIKRIEEEQRLFQQKNDSVLPSEFVAEFESRFVRKRDSQTEQGLRMTSRAFVTWRAAQRMIVGIGVDPSEWFFHTYQIYDFIHAQKWSLRYVSGILKVANLWGFFVSRKMARPFLPIPFPKGYERQRIIEANYEKVRGVTRASKPLLPLHLEDVRSKINLQNFNWLYLTVWFGLRPKEVDFLKRKNMWRLEILGNGRKILWVFQTKIVALPPEDRWKPIPIIFAEQESALEVIEKKNFKRPLMKTMKKYFGAGRTLYAGRKGFSDLMLSKNQSFENISVWMGHSTLQRTWYSYKSRRRFHISGF